MATAVSGGRAPGTDGTPSSRRGRTRPGRTAPQPDPGLAHLDLAALREQRALVLAEGDRTSYWRRVVQARLDLLLSPLAARRGAGAPVVEQVAQALADPTSPLHRRAVAPLPLHPLGPPALDGLGDLLGPVGDGDGAADAAERVLELSALEQRLSAYRTRVHLEADRLTAELVARYHRDPASALVALPQVPEPPAPRRR